jgi:hypothetical protein
MLTKRKNLNNSIFQETNILPDELTDDAEFWNEWAAEKDGWDLANKKRRLGLENRKYKANLL